MKGKEKKRGPIIAIDGPSGVGKTTISKLVAQSLGFRYIETGAMYRAFAVAANDAGVNVDDEDELEEFSKGIEVTFDNNYEKIFINNKDYSGRIRDASSGELASRASSKKAVRDFLVRLQRELGHEGCVVMEGRDIGTVVFPDADVKIFLDAKSEVRAGRRHAQLSASPGFAENGGATVDAEKVAGDIEERDRRDSTRRHSPLKKADDAVYVDTSEAGVRDIEKRVLGIIKERTGIGDNNR
ncbi:MAG: (d)CMP kinase [Deltaproteobacteria bacterium]|nr:(d)CMP kinase [Deltaproteobacteria bacterium]